MENQARVAVNPDGSFVVAYVSVGATLGRPDQVVFHRFDEVMRHERLAVVLANVAMRGNARL